MRPEPTSTNVTMSHTTFRESLPARPTYIPALELQARYVSLDLDDQARNHSPRNAKLYSKRKKSRSSILPAFLSKTYQIFSQPEFSAICGWDVNGDIIIIRQLKAFVSQVLPQFFNHRNLPSFVRQLNLYGFHKAVLDSRRLEFQHPLFKRDRIDLLYKIKRKVTSSSGVDGTKQPSPFAKHPKMFDFAMREMDYLRQTNERLEKRLMELERDSVVCVFLLLRKSEYLCCLVRMCGRTGTFCRRIWMLTRKCRF